MEEIVGKKFNRLTVVADLGNDNKHRTRKVRVLCDCGNEKELYFGAVKSGSTKACGCMVRDKLTAMIGQTYNRWTVIGLPDARNTGNVIARCACGTVTNVNASNVKRGLSQSCGCYSIEQLTKWGPEGVRLRSIYGHMIGRCHNQDDVSYHNYGGRGIAVCSEWRGSFEAFYRWALANGYVDPLTLDRVDNDLGYSPENCQWLPLRENVRKTRRVKMTPEKRRMVRGLTTLGWTQRKIGAHLGVAHSCVGNVLRGESWYD